MSSGVAVHGAPVDPLVIVRVLDQEAHRAGERTGEFVERAVDAEAPHGPSGRLASSAKATVRQVGKGVSVTVRPTARHAKWVTGGTGLYVEHHSRVRAKRRKGRYTRQGFPARGALRTPFGYRASVRGQRPNPFVQRAGEATRLEAERILASGASRAAVRLGGRG